MYYSVIGLIALTILLIENRDILLNCYGAFDKPAWKVYRRFLLTVIAYYITDILWGILEARKLAGLLFVDTSIYFIAMAAGVLFWTQYVVTYLEEHSAFGVFLVYAGRIIALIVALMSVVNIFVPVLFTVDGQCVYHAFGVRYVILISQILVLLLISVYALSSMIRRRKRGEGVYRYRTMGSFGLIMAIFLTAQLLYPYLPLYAIAYMLGTCLLRAFVVADEKEEYRNALKEAEKITELKQSITALLDNMPALSFSKDASTGVYLACNQAFAEYAHKDSPEGVAGLTDAEIFDEETAKHFVEDDKMALSMDAPYIFFEDVPDAVGKQRQFQTTKLKFKDASGRLCTLGMSQDVTDMVRIQRENALTKEAYERARNTGIIFTHIAQTLAHGYEDLFYVNHETGDFIEYHTDEETGALKEARRGVQFFESCKREVKIYVYQDDWDLFTEAMDRDTLLKALERNKAFFMTYRLILDNKPAYVRMKVSQMEDDERFIIIGVTNVDEEMRQQRAAERVKEERIAYSRLNALSGDFLAVYVVIPETGDYREFSANIGFRNFEIPREGKDFFETVREKSETAVHPDDRERFLTMFTRDEVMSEIERNGIFAISYRLLVNDEPNYVQLKAAMVKEQEGDRLIVGINDIDALVRQEEDFARRLAQAQSMANIDALTGVKNKHAYLDEEEKMNHLIGEHNGSDFAIVIMDVNDLKKVNDTQGHQAGDQYLRDACKLICDIFKRSPVFRIGGDEFTVVVQGDDYSCIEELLGKVNDHNAEALRNGGIVIACGMSRYDHDESVASVFERADDDMYENKKKLKSGT